MTQKIAFLGLGAMGSRMAAKLLAAGFELNVWNRTAERAAPLAALGADVADSPRAAAENADLVISMVRDDEASQFVWLDETYGALQSMKENAVGIECSTLTVEHVKQLHKMASDQGLAFLDAPLAGSRPQAEAGQLIFFTGGDAAALDRARPALDVMGGVTHHVGEAGAGSSIKLAVNALFGIQVAALAELIEMLRVSGANIERAVEVLKAAPVMSPAAAVAAGGMLNKAFQPLFPIELAEKDFACVQATASKTPISNAARAVLQHAIADGYGADHLTGLAQLYDFAKEKSVA